MRRSSTWLKAAPYPAAGYGAYDVGHDGRLNNKTLHIDANGPGAFDGIKCDVDGNIWAGWGSNGALDADAAALDGVMVFNPQGKPIAHIHLPERCANLCFGGSRQQPPVHGQQPFPLRAVRQHTRRRSASGKFRGFRDVCQTLLSQPSRPEPGRSTRNPDPAGWARACAHAFQLQPFIEHRLQPLEMLQPGLLRVRRGQSAGESPLRNAGPACGP